MRVRMFAAAAAVGLCAFGAQAQGNLDAAATRKVVDTIRPAMVTVEVVVSISMPKYGSSKQELNLEVNGLVVDPSGLAVLCLSDIDPASILGSLIGDEMGSMQSEVSNVRYLMEDGTEIPAKIVLRDKDQNLAFMRPATHPATPMAAVDLKNTAVADILDPVIVVSRMGKVGNHVLSARVDRIMSVIPKPRRRYVVDTVNLGSELGGAVVTPDGHIVGVVSVKATRSDGEPSQSSVSRNLAQVVVAADDVLSVAAQAPENAAPEPKVKPAAPDKKPAAPAKKPAAPKKAK